MKKNQTAFLKGCLADALLQQMEAKAFDAINVNEICRQAGIGRTTFYRHFDNKNSKEDLLVFKIVDEWERYTDRHWEEAVRDRGFALTCFIYENRRLFSFLYSKGLIGVVMRAMEELIPAGEDCGKEASYLMSFFTYGYFGIIYQWIKYGFDETPEQVQKHIQDTFSAGGAPRPDGRQEGGVL